MSQKQFDNKLYNKLHEYSHDYDAQEAWLGMDEKLAVLNTPSIFGSLAWKAAFAGIISLLVGVSIYFVLSSTQVVEADPTIINTLDIAITQNTSQTTDRFEENIVQDQSENSIAYSLNKENTALNNIKSSGSKTPKSVFSATESSKKNTTLVEKHTFSSTPITEDKLTKRVHEVIVDNRITHENSVFSRALTDIVYSPLLAVNELEFERVSIANFGIIHNNYDNLYPASNRFFSVELSSGILETSLSGHASQENYITKRTVTESALERLSLSFKFEKHITDQFYLGSGIGFTRLAKSVHNTQLDTSSVILQDQVTSIFVESNGDSTNIIDDVQAIQITSLEQKLYNNHYQLQIPLFFGYRKAMTDRLSVALESGAYFTIKTINKGQILSPNFIENELMNIEENGYKSIGNINAYLGINLSYAFYKNQMLHLGINNMWDINGLQSNDSEIKEKMNSLNISLAWKFAF